MVIWGSKLELEFLSTIEVYGSLGLVLINSQLPEGI